MPQNCKYLSAPTSSGSSGTCYACNKSFALAGQSYTCVGFDSDDNCMVASDSEDGCMGCWAAYYFNGATCTLKSNLFILGLVAIVGLIASFN